MERHRRDQVARASDLRATGELALRRALERDELAAQFQPIVSTASGEVAGLEALLRWQRPQGRLLAAKEFVPSARRAGLISQVDHRMMGVVARELVRAELPDGLKWLSVNVASRSLRDLEVKQRILELAAELARYDLHLLIEVTERVTEPVPGDVAETLKSLREEGVLVALDDFGREPVNLDRLLHLPIDVVKIDGRDPVVGLRHLSDRQGYAGALIGLCHSLGRTVVLKQIEERLRPPESPVNEADFVQGNYFARPEFLDV